MSKVKYILFSALFYVFSAVSAVAYFIAESVFQVEIRTSERLSVLILAALSIYAAAKVLSVAYPRSVQRIMKISFGIIFVMYAALLVDLTLFDSMFGRKINITAIISDRDMLNEYITKHVRMVPFSTVKRYISAIEDGSLNMKIIVINLLGNIAAFMPMAFFLPLLSKKCRSFPRFFILTTAMVMLVEQAQLLFAAGICDVDDLILNVGGACLMYIVLRIRPIGITLDKLTYINAFGPRRAKLRHQ